MDAPIGIFDSGIGGLTIAKALVERLPRESLYYVGDTAHMPYGDKSPERLNEYASGIAQRLTQAGCKALVVACNSASSNALDAVRKVAGPKVPVIGVVEPVVHWAQLHHPQGTLSLIGTRATVQSGVYQTRMKAHGLALRTRATPLLASAIEEGFHNGTIPEAVVKAYFADGWAQDTDGSWRARITLSQCPSSKPSFGPTCRFWMLLPSWQKRSHASFLTDTFCLSVRHLRIVLRSRIGHALSQMVPPTSWAAASIWCKSNGPSLMARQAIGTKKRSPRTGLQFGPNGRAVLD